MARASNAKPLDDKARSVRTASAAAGSGALRTAAAAGRRKRGSAKARSRLVRLAGMCDEAANHLARAHSALHDEVTGGDAAIAHLDAALACLNRLAAEGEKRPARSGAKSGARPARKAKSA